MWESFSLIRSQLSHFTETYPNHSTQSQAPLFSIVVWMCLFWSVKYSSVYHSPVCLPFLNVILGEWHTQSYIPSLTQNRHSMNILKNCLRSAPNFRWRKALRKGPIILLVIQTVTMKQCSRQPRTWAPFSLSWISDPRTCVMLEKLGKLLSFSLFSHCEMRL